MLDHTIRLPFIEGYCAENGPMDLFATYFSEDDGLLPNAPWELKAEVAFLRCEDSSDVVNDEETVVKVLYKGDPYGRCLERGKAYEARPTYGLFRIRDEADGLYYGYVPEYFEVIGTIEDGGDRW